jgi:HSP20 family protein
VAGLEFERRRKVMTVFSFPSRFDPMDALQRLQKELERAFENPTGFDLGTSGRGVFPPVNVLSDKDGLIVRLEVPGILPENLSIEASARTLTISGKREPNAPASAGFHRRERWSGEFSRSLQLPKDVDSSQAEASYKHGVLSIRIPKHEEARPRQIEVTTQ